MALQRRGEGRVIIGLPERLERTRNALKASEHMVAEIKLLVESRPLIGDEAVLHEIEAILRGEDE